MKELLKLDLINSTIVEHCNSGNVIGSVVHRGASGQGKVCIGWRNKETAHRTTIFSPESWVLEKVRNVIFLRRIAKDQGNSDLPLPDVDLYTIIF